MEGTEAGRSPLTRLHCIEVNPAQILPLPQDQLIEGNGEGAGEEIA